MESKQGSTTELIVGLILGLIVISVAVYWMYSASTGSVPFVLAFGLPNNLVVNLVILVVLAAIVGYVYFNVVRAKR